MTILDEIQSLWNSEEARDLSSVLQQLILLLADAHKNGEDIPPILEMDILLAANYSFGYGGQLDQAQSIFHLLSQLKSTISTADSIPLSEMNKILRLACTGCSALLSTMSSDTYNNERNAWSLISWAGYSKTSTKAQILKFSIEFMLDYLQLSTNSTWKYELISFIVTMYSILSQLNQTLATSIFENIKENIQPHFSMSDENQLPPIISKWKGEWNEKNDYFRFTSLMITNDHSPEDLWLNLIMKFTGLSK